VLHALWFDIAGAGASVDLRHSPSYARGEVVEMPDVPAQGFVVRAPHNIDIATAHELAYASPKRSPHMGTSCWTAAR
jgi:hypothetical protein